MVFSYKKTTVDNLRVLKPGSHIRVVRGSSESREHGFYDHHMLVVSVPTESNQLRVIHYTQTGGEGIGSLASFGSGQGGAAEVIEETVKIQRGDKIELLEYQGDVQCFSAAESIERARAKLGEKEYSLFSNNCECFVNWAITDQAVSNQVQAGLLNVGAGAVAGAFTGFFQDGGSWGKAFQGAMKGASTGYTRYREKRD